MAAWRPLLVAVVVAAAAAAARGQGAPPIVALSPADHFTCGGACADKVPDAPAASVPAVVDFLMTGRRGDATGPLIDKMADGAREPLELVLVIVADKAKHSADQLLAAYSTAVFGDSQGSSILGSFVNSEGPSHISAASIQARYTSAAVLTKDQLQALPDAQDPRLTNKAPDLILVKAEDTAASLGYVDVVASLGQATNRNVALVLVAEAVSPPTQSGTNTTGSTEDEDGLLAGGMRPPEIDSAGVMGLLAAALLLLIFVPGFLCLWNIEPPQTFETPDRDGAKKKNV